MFAKYYFELSNKIGVHEALVYGAIEFHSNLSGLAFIAQENMAKELAISRCTVNRAIKTLCAVGLVEDTTPNLGNQPHKYRLGISIEDFMKYTESESELNA